MSSLNDLRGPRRQLGDFASNVPITKSPYHEIATLDRAEVDRATGDAGGAHARPELLAGGSSGSKTASSDCRAGRPRTTPLTPEVALGPGRHLQTAAIGSPDAGSGTLIAIILASPHSWSKASQIIGEDAHHLVQAGVFVTRVLVERLVADDADGATQTLDFSYRGADYQIDLSARDARALDKLLARVLAVAGARGKPPVPPRPVTKTSGGVPAAKTVRAWAKTQGIEVSDRGRIAADVRKRYQGAHGA